FRRCPLRLAGCGRLGRLEMQRAAAERSETGAEDHAGIDEIRARDHTLVPAALALGDQRLDELAAEALQLSLLVRFLGLLRPAVFPDVEALTGFLAELAQAHHPVELRAAITEA